MTDPRPPLPRPLAALREATRSTLGDWKAHLVYGILIAIVGSWLLFPAGSWLLVKALEAASGGSVVNTAITSLAFSISGILVFVLGATLVGILVVAAGAGHASVAAERALGHHLSVRDAFRRMLARLPGVPGIGAVKIALLAALGAPVLGSVVACLAGFVLGAFHGIQDLKPLVPRGLPVPLWMVAAAMAVMFVIFSWLYVRWSLAIAAFTLEGVSLTEATRSSARRTRGWFWRIGLAHLAHHLTIALLMGVLLLLMRLAGRPLLTWLFERSEKSGAVGIAVLLAVFWAFAGAIQILGVGRLISLTVVHHAALGGALDREGARAGTGSRRFRLGLTVLAGLAAVAFATSVWLAVPRVEEELKTASHRTVVTAHRAGPIDAPENTMTALMRAIDAGSHSAEIDVQQAKDGTIVVVHDPNLQRLAGVDANVWELTREELSRLDVGSHHSPAFRGEKIPTLEQMMDAARDRIVLNVELKTNGHENAAFVPDVVALLRRRDFLDRCFITSLEARFLEQVRSLEPRLRVGIIITAKVGSGSDLDVDLYSVQPLVATSDFIRRAHAAGREVHVWTVNESGDVSRFADRAADALITDDPRLARKVLDARTPTDGIRGAVRRLFGID